MTSFRVPHPVEEAPLDYRPPLAAFLLLTLLVLGLVYRSRARRLQRQKDGTPTPARLDPGSKGRMFRATSAHL